MLVNLLLALDAKALICLVAPAGYGKTTLLAQWAQDRGRRVGWVSLDRHDNDPVVLLTYIAAAVDRVEPIDPGVFHALTSPGASLAATVVPRLAAAVSSMTQPLALVLDHMEVLSNWECLHMVAELAAQLPKGSQLLLASRATLPLPVALLRARGQLVEIGIDELAMDQQEGYALLDGAGVQLAQAETTELIKRTEGWPAGLYLAALALRAGDSGRSGGIAFTGDDQFVAEYLRSEVLARLSSEQLTFLTRTSVLERMCGPLCDAVLAAKGSDQVLETLVRSNLLLIPLDRRHGWYRYHHLFQELLRAELDRREPKLVPELHVRAAVWCEANGLPELAIDHAQAADDTDRAARLVASATIPTYAGGRIETVGRWLQWFQDHGVVEQHLPVAVLGTFVQALLGKPAAAERWAAATEHGAAGALPDGSTAESWVALVRALLCRDGVDRMGADAEIAVAELAPASRWRPPALFLEGVVWILAGEPDRADPVLAHTVEVATKVGGLPVASVALAERAIVAMQQQDWKRAATLAEQASGVVEAGHLDNYIMSALVYSVAARTALHQGKVSQAHQQLARAARLRPLLTSAIPWLAVQTLLEQGHVWLVLDDAAGARVVLRQAHDILRRRPDLGVLPSQTEELQSKLNTLHADTKGVSSLSTAELRLLPLLSTHLTFAEIGQRLYLSHNTVKTQAISIYRKLGVASRGQAVQRAQQLGLSG
ncbi:MAG: LuxR C-terminal-related transcriptional regulator [Actinomycetes bacterium]